ncbi:DUF883 family protein [Caenimonas aquaedulcis]|uniref:DUF883 domain-containing protein n=1 Tax=Caenimonas aquaedulcis TaxID=2793270 RepID=A0A931H7Z6_9BURK|nr:DUF883 family protein [Caenimonas aquaedulcis]MBG9390208.1 DUF883 domain-containing protein [Caenimonas aquaedulcis]
MNDTTHTPSLRADQERLAQDLRAVVRDAEELLRHAVGEAGQGYSQARERLERSLGTAKSEMAAIEAALLAGARDAGRTADQYVSRHPWQSVGIGAGIGLLVGMLVARR